MIGYVKHFDSSKTMSFKVSDNKLVNNYTKIWERVGNLMNGDNDKYIKTKIKLHGDKNKYQKKMYQISGYH